MPEKFFLKFVTEMFPNQSGAKYPDGRRRPSFLSAGGAELRSLIDQLISRNRRLTWHAAVFLTNSFVSSTFQLVTVPASWYTMGEREDLVYQAKLAEQAERYDGKPYFRGFLPSSQRIFPPSLN